MTQKCNNSEDTHTKRCLYCGKAFTGIVGTRKFCNVDCSKAYWSKTERTCTICGATFTYDRPVTRCLPCRTARKREYDREHKKKKYEINFKGGCAEDWQKTRETKVNKSHRTSIKAFEKYCKKNPHNRMSYGMWIAKQTGRI